MTLHSQGCIVLGTTQVSTTTQPTYIQHTALAKLISGVTYGHPIAPRTMNVLEREGWVLNGAVTDAGRLAWSGTANPSVAAPAPSKSHRCDEDCYQGYCDQMVYPAR